MAVELVTDINSATFSTTGPTVDAGFICATGVTEFSGKGEADPSALGRWEDLYTCEDGSGTFVVGADEFHEDYEHVSGVWDIGSGTGSDAGIAGRGSVDTLHAQGSTIVGWVWLTEENLTRRGR